MDDPAKDAGTEKGLSEEQIKAIQEQEAKRAADEQVAVANQAEADLNAEAARIAAEDKAKAEAGAKDQSNTTEYVVDESRQRNASALDVPVEDRTPEERLAVLEHEFTIFKNQPVGGVRAAPAAQVPEHSAAIQQQVLNLRQQLEDLTRRVNALGLH